MNDTNDKIRSFILSDLQFAGPADELTDDYPLIGNNALDSLGIFHLVSFLERQFGVQIDDHELVPDNFGTIGRIAALVHQKQVQ